jgi:hypothetical protein
MDVIVVRLDDYSVIQLACHELREFRFALMHLGLGFVL